MVGLLPTAAFLACGPAEDGTGTVPPMGGAGGSGAGTAPISGAAPVGGAAGTAPIAGSTSGGKAGAGGAAGTGGVAGGAGGVAGTGGSAGTGGGGAPPAAVTIDGLDGMLIVTPCDSAQTTDDCAGGGWIYKGETRDCVNARLDTDAAGATLLDFPVSGVPGQAYIATMHFYGVMEPKIYGNDATREAGAERPNVGANPSVPDPYATADGGSGYPESTYNTYEIHVINDQGAEVARHYINSDLQEGHFTFGISYERPIEVIGGGKIHVRIFDLNCRMIKNCGTGGYPCNTKARTIDISAADPQPAAGTLMQPGLGLDSNNAGQWWLIDVKTIVPKP
jgi:hypothetical protein